MALTGKKNLGETLSRAGLAPTAEQAEKPAKIAVRALIAITSTAPLRAYLFRESVPEADFSLLKALIENIVTAARPALR